MCRCDPRPHPTHSTPTPNQSSSGPGPESAPLSSSLLSSPPLPPSVGGGSGDDLWLPGLAGHLGATLCDDWGAGRGVAVQTEAAHRVLQGRAFRLPLLQREREREDGKMKSINQMSFSVTASTHE